MFVTAMIGAGPFRVITDYDFDTVNRASYTFTVDIGTVTSDRVVALALGAFAPDDAANLSTVTINGNAATINAYEKGFVTSAIVRTVMAGVISLPVATGTTATVVATFSTGSFLQINACAIAVYSLYNLQSSTAFDANDARNNSGASVSTTLNIPGGGICIASSGVLLDAGTVSMTGVTQDFQQALITNRKVTAGSSENMNAETGRTISQTGASANPSCIAAASWS